MTATVNDAQADLDFCAGALGLRLVKKTVNFDNHHVFHFYYGNERGLPGTLWTTFPYKGHGVPRRHAWRGTNHGDLVLRAGRIPRLVAIPSELTRRCRAGRTRALRRPAIACKDSSGLEFELIGSARDERAPWTAAGVGPEAAVRGLHSVTMVVRSPMRTLELVTGLLGFEKVNEDHGRIRVAIGGDAPGRVIDIVSDWEMPQAVNGLGTVHHVAMAVATGEEQRRLRRS